MIAKALALVPVEDIAHAILILRGQKVLLDSDLAALYGVPTKALNQAVKRNSDRFPEDFLFRLTGPETDAVNRSQIVTGSQKHRDPRFPPFAFTEHGAIMAATILNSARAVEMSIYVVRAFAIRELMNPPALRAGRLDSLPIWSGGHNIAPSYECPLCKLQARLQLLTVDQGGSGIAVPKG